MASTKQSRDDILAKFFDDGIYTPLFAQTDDTAVSAAFGCVAGCPAYTVVQSGAAVSKKDLDKAVKTLELAAKTGNAVVTYYDSVGANVAEGLDALAAAAKLNAAVANVSGVVPQIAVVNGVCGASAALAAANADICIAVEGCEMFFTPTFTAKAAGDKLEGAGTAKKAEEAGVAHIVAKDTDEAVAAARKLVAVLPCNNLSSTAAFEYTNPAEKINTSKYSAKQAAAALCDADSAVELFENYGKNVYTALATVTGNVCGIVATEKVLCKNAVSKAARFVRLCDAFNIPVVTVVATDGFAKSSTEDVAGGLRAAARLSATYADATTAKICVVAGKAIGAAYTALCNADITIALDSAVVCPVEPAAAATIMYKDELADSKNLEKDTAALAKKYVKENANADALVAAGLADMTATADTAFGAVVNAMDMLSSKRVQRMPKKHGNMSL